MKTSGFWRLGFAVAGTLLVLHCGPRAGGEHEDSTISVPDDDPAMVAAIQRARSTVPEFVRRLRNPRPTQTFASIKLPLHEGETTEHVWLSDLTFDGRRFHGRIDNDVQWLHGWRLGDTVSVASDSISDWLVIDDSLAVGGYSVRVLRDRMSDRERADWDAEAPYRFAADSGP